MSGQAKRSRWRYLTRRREALARLLVHSLDIGVGDEVYSPQSGVPAKPSRPFAALLHGDGSFDVHAARELARSLIALEAEQAVFEDWTRERGLGPENREPGAFTDCGACGGTGVERRAPGWDEPGDCMQCDGADEGEVRGGWPGKLAREWPGDSRAPMGRTLAKLGRDLLDALEGQPSYCPLEVNRAEQHRRRSLLGRKIVCTACHGTGHNLRGVLPAVEVSPQMLRRLTEGEGGYYMDEQATWLSAVATLTNDEAQALELMGPDGVDGRTRVVPRGEHRPRSTSSKRPGELDRSWTLDARIEARGAVDTTPLDREPRWRRGELRHAQQRRERELRRAG